VSVIRCVAPHRRPVVVIDDALVGAVASQPGAP
jgi:hypothetical protein